MAHYLRRPVTSAIGIQLFKPLRQRRLFSKISPQWAPTVKEPASPEIKRQFDRSIRVASKELGITSNDLGLVPKTFLFPRGANRPSLFQNPGGVLKLCYTWLRSRFVSYASVIVYKYANKATRIKLLSRQIAPTALGLQRQMYSAFAAGDLRLLETVCCEGLRDSLKARIAARPAGERWEWELVRYNGAARVVSHRAALLGVEGMGIRQAVVRIRSVQRLTRYKGPGQEKMVEGSGREKETVEYLVIQRFLNKGLEGGWMVWGTMEETTLSALGAQEEVEGLP